MKRLISVAVVLVAMAAVGGLAAVSAEHGEWAKGPASYLMTREDLAAWKKVGNDQQAEEFEALFWARRDPTPSTPRNEFREEFERRVKYSDDQFSVGKKIRGAMTDRGKAFVVFGAPKKVERTGTQRTAALPSGIAEDPANNPAQEDNEAQVWTYEGDAVKEIFGSAKATIKFVDRFGNSEFRLDRSGTADVGSAQQRAVQLAIAQPGLTKVPTFEAPPPVVEAPVVVTALTNEALKTAVAELKAAAKNPYEKQIHSSWGEFVTAAGQYFVPVMLYVPKVTGLTADQELTFFGVVEDASGAGVLAFEDAVKLAATKEDFFVDKTLALGAGKHRGIFGLAQDGKAVAMIAMEMDLAGSLDKDATAISALILSNNVYPLMQAQRPDDPFAFGGVKVVPKADKVFRATDELWYFFELRNPGLPEAAPAAPAATVDLAAPAEPAAAAPAPEVEPKIQVKIDVEGTITTGQKVKRSAPPMEVGAIAMKGVPGHYGIGSAIPLSTFKPGDYTFSVKVIDTVKKTSYTLSEKFKVVE